MTKLNAAGLRLGLQELTRIIELLEWHERTASEAYARAEQDILAYRKLLAFVKGQRDDFREQLIALEQV